MTMSVWRCADQSKLTPSTMMPPIAVPWGPIYFVVECTTIAAPCSRGRQINGRGRVVHDQRHAELAPDRCHLGDGKRGELWVGQRLGIEGACALVRRSPECLRICWIHEARTDAHRRQGIGEQVPSAAVEVGGAHHIVAGTA